MRVRDGGLNPVAPLATCVWRLGRTMTDTDNPTDGRTDGGTDILADPPVYAARVEKHREALT